MVLAVEPKLSLCLVTMKEEKGKHISERKRREEKTMLSIPYRTGRYGRNIPYRPAIRYG